MKKIFTLLFAVGTISIASAQSGNFNHFKVSVSYADNGKQKEISQINREYDFKIRSVNMDRHLNRWEKSKQVRSLERQRDQEIALVQYRSKNDHRGYGDDKFGNKNTHKW